MVTKRGMSWIFGRPNQTFAIDVLRPICCNSDTGMSFITHLQLNSQMTEKIYKQEARLFLRNRV